MKLKYNNVTIEFSNGETIGEIVEELEELFPNGRWADFEIVDSTCYCYSPSPNTNEILIKPKEWEVTKT